MKDKTINMLSWLMGSAFLIILDQYTKHLASTHLKGAPPFVILKGIFELYYSENRGAAFGILQGQQGFFFLIALIALSFAGFLMYRMPGFHNKRYHWMKFCVIMITAGAAGNMIDRSIQGYVVDFLYFSLINFPIFNVADIYVTVSAALFIVLLCFYYEESEFEIFHLKPLSKQKEEQH